jgi:hypothetical protein
MPASVGMNASACRCVSSRHFASQIVVTCLRFTGPAEGSWVLMEQARSQGAEITREPSETFYGGYAGAFRDLDGHTWEVAHNPGFGLDSAGNVVLPASYPAAPARFRPRTPRCFLGGRCQETGGGGVDRSCRKAPSG